MKLNFEKLNAAVAAAKAKLDELEQKVENLEAQLAAETADAAENQANLDKAAGELAKGDVVGSTGGITQSE